MSEAVGIHDHPTKKLGKRPPSNKPAIQLRDHLLAGALDRAQGPLPGYPAVDPSPSARWAMLLNDQWGDCVVAGGYHAQQAIDTLLGAAYTDPATAQILADYRTQNPTFDPNSPNNGPGSNADGGMDIQTYLNYLVKQGRILGFAKVDHTNEAEVKAATYIGLGIVTGQVMQVAQQQGKTWDNTPGSPDWGGHCTVWTGYLGSPDQDTTISWGDVYEMTQGFVTNRVEEAWFVVTQTLWDHPAFRDNFNQQSFAAAFTAITGSPFPAPVPPAPAPPPPSPTPPPPAPTPPPPAPTPPPPAPTPPPPGPTPPAPPPGPPPNSPSWFQRWWREFEQWFVRSFGVRPPGPDDQ